MANIESLEFSITRKSFPGGHICSVDYSYYIHIDLEQYESNEIFRIDVELHGDDLMKDKLIGDPPYDTHTIDAHGKMPQSRSFAIDCDLLDESWGEDRIFLRIFVNSNRGERLTEKTASIKDWF
ncbi:MAG: hypothetical protein ACC707_09945 [Thiohalomonadales bacterium]